MDVIRVLIIHHEASARARLRRLLEQEPGIDLVGERADTTNAAPFIRESQPHLIFLEAPFRDEHVMLMLDRISGTLPPLIVFVSAYNEHAVRAFEASALDYLLVPFTNERFRQTLSRARERLHEHHIIAYSERLLHLLQRYHKFGHAARSDALPPPYEDRLVVKTGNRLVFLDIDEIDWIESEGVYVRIHVGAKSHLLRESLQNVEDRLHPRKFIRIHRSTIVNVHRIKEVVPHTNGGAIVNLRDGTRLKLSRSYRDRLSSSLG